eukprot:4913841-Ditylum_brightwellii.AAC.1
MALRMAHTLDGGRVGGSVGTHIGNDSRSRLSSVHIMIPWSQNVPGAQSSSRQPPCPSHTMNHEGLWQ